MYGVPPTGRRVLGKSRRNPPYKPRYCPSLKTDETSSHHDLEKENCDARVVLRGNNRWRVPILRELGPSTVCLRQRILWLWSGVLWLCGSPASPPVLRLCSSPDVLLIFGPSLFHLRISGVLRELRVWCLLWWWWIRIRRGCRRRSPRILWCQSWCRSRLWISSSRHWPGWVARRLWLSCSRCG